MKALKGSIVLVAILGLGAFFAFSANIALANHEPGHVDLDPDAITSVTGPAGQVTTGQTRGSCGIGANFLIGDGTLLACIDYAVAYVVYWILSLMAFLLGITGVVLDTVIRLTVVEMSRYFNAGDASAVSLAWSVFRDLANIVIIFVFLALGIATILQVESHSAKRILPKVIIIAILLNFSIFFCKAAIDVTNIIGLQFYDAIQTMPAVINDPNSVGRGDISGILMTKLGLTTLYKTGRTGVTGGDSSDEAFLEQTDTLSTAAVIFIGFAGTILFLVATFVLGAAALTLIARLIVLIFLTALSPLAFVAMTLPSTSKYWTRWLDAFTKNALYAPVFMMMLWVSLNVINGMTALTTQAGATQASFAQMWADPTSVGALFMHFAIMVGMLLGSLMIAKEMGAYGAAGAVKGLDSARRWGQGAVTRGAGAATFGAVGLAARNTLGYGANQRANNTVLLDRASKGSLSAKVQLAAARAMSKSTFDARNTTVVKSASKAAGIELGSSKGGFKDRQEAAQKAQEKYAKGLGEADTKKQKDELKALKQKREDLEDITKDGSPAKAVEDAKGNLRKQKQALQEKQRQLQEEQQKVRDAQQAYNFAKDRGASPEDLKKAQDDVATAQAKTVTAQTAVKTAQEEAAKADDAVSDAERALAIEKKKLAQQIKDQEEEIKKVGRARQTNYATYLENMGNISGEFWTGLTPEYRAKAVSKIKEGDDKDSKLRKALKEATGDEDDEKKDKEKKDDTAKA